MVERPSEIRSGLACPICGRTLLPIPAETTVTFHCRSGHELSLQDLLAAQSLALRMGLETLLLEWTRKHQALVKTVEDARANGFLDVAEIFLRHARTLEWRIGVLRTAFTQTDSSRLIVVPKASVPAP